MEWKDTGIDTEGKEDAFLEVSGFFANCIEAEEREDEAEEGEVAEGGDGAEAKA